MYGAVENTIGVIQQVNSGRLQLRCSDEPLKDFSGTALQDRLATHDHEMENWGDIGAYTIPSLCAEQPQTRPIYTEEVRFSWGMRAEKDHTTPSRLHGKAYRCANPMQQISPSEYELRKPDRFSEDDISDLVRLPVLYHIHNDARTVVEIGFWGSNRWQQATPADYLELEYAMPDWDDGLRNDYNSTAILGECHPLECSSGGVGAKLEMGEFV
jgi:hypothetical protein